jgi:hypothetical protein
VVGDGLDAKNAGLPGKHREMEFVSVREHVREDELSVAIAGGMADRAKWRVAVTKPPNGNRQSRQRPPDRQAHGRDLPAVGEEQAGNFDIDRDGRW